ncbi:MAG: efflux RND transporter periplasmic adaptor subunit [Candidatus Moranbacteria bacterium]|nr:efflux RND transporter periplasmic adaptor subunit [Candidatus Moranbacteria bacterium]
MKRKDIVTFGLIILTAVFFVAVAVHFRKTSTPAPETSRPAPEVTVQSVAASHIYMESVQYPANIVGDQEIQVAATATGTATVANFSLGDYVPAGALLVKIDNIGPNLKTEKAGFESSAVQQSYLSVKQAEENLDLAEENYDNIKDQYDYQKKNPTAAQTVTKADRDAAKKAVDLAEIALENAKVGYKGTLDNHLVTSPISGYVTEKSVSAGDSVSNGQTLFSISKTKKVKVQFFVDENQLSSLAKGQIITLADNSGNQIPVVIQNVSPQADTATKRFLIEAYPKSPNENTLIAGTVVGVSFFFSKNPSQPDTLILPLAALNVGQNENYIFTAEDGKAKKVNVDVVQVSGQTVEIKAGLSSDAEIIINGSKLVRDGQVINISK